MIRRENGERHHTDASDDLLSGGRMDDVNEPSDHNAEFEDLVKEHPDPGHVSPANLSNAMLGEMLNPLVRPNGWRAHVLCAETRPCECLAHVQTLVTEDWPAPIYAVRLAHPAPATYTLRLLVGLPQRQPKLCADTIRERQTRQGALDDNGFAVSSRLQEGEDCNTAAQT